MLSKESDWGKKLPQRYLHIPAHYHLQFKETLHKEHFQWFTGLPPINICALLRTSKSWGRAVFSLERSNIPILCRSVYEHAQAALATRNHTESKCPRSQPLSCTNLLLPYSTSLRAPSSFHERSVRFLSAVLISSTDFAWTRYKPIQTTYFAELLEWLCYISFL